MSMQRDRCRPRSRGAALLCCLAFGFAGAGCSSVDPTAITQALSSSFTPSAMPHDARVTFESIDGAPADVAARLSAELKVAASARQITVLPTSGDGAYRVRGYLAAHADRGATSVSWAWDVYDTDLHRAFRLGGEEGGGRDATPGRPWAAADEALLQRIARASMDQLAAFMAAPPQPPAPDDASPRGGAAVAALEPAETDVATADGPTPLPRRRPPLAGLTATAALDGR
jgi:hypothetical protein